MSVALDPNAAVNDLADRFWEGILDRDPMWATVLGDERYNDRWPDLGPDGRAADEAAYRAALAEAREIPADGLEPEQVITRDLLILVCENALAALDQKQYQLAVDHMSGPQVGRQRWRSTSRPTRPSGSRAARALRDLPGDDRAVHRHPRGGRRRWPDLGDHPGPARDRADRPAAGDDARRPPGVVDGAGRRRRARAVRRGGRGAHLPDTPPPAGLPGARATSSTRVRSRG